MFGRSSKNLKILRNQDSTLRRLISRTRSIIKEALDGTEWENAAEWMVYRDRDELWRFVQLKEL